MLGVVEATKGFVSQSESRILLNKVTFLMKPNERVALLCPPESGKTTLARILMGIEPLDSGFVVRKGCRLSWPLGFSGFLYPELTGEQNIRLLAQQMSRSCDEAVARCEMIAELGGALRESVKRYSSSMKARLAWGCSLAFDFTTYLADDSVGSGDPAFRDRCEAALNQRLEESGLLLLTRNPRLSSRFCHKHGLLANGRLQLFPSYEEALTAYGETIGEL